MNTSKSNIIQFPSIFGNNLDSNGQYKTKYVPQPDPNDIYKTDAQLESEAEVSSEDYDDDELTTFTLPTKEEKFREKLKELEEDKARITAQLKKICKDAKAQDDISPHLRKNSNIAHLIP